VALTAKQFPRWLFWECGLVWVRFIVIISVVTTSVPGVRDCLPACLFVLGNVTGIRV
jgi:hypothetical protein